MVLSIKADYQFEIRLLSYVNLRGLDAEQMCCEPEAMINGNCIPQATCDTQFNIRLQNFHQLIQLGSNIVLGTFDNMNSITFPSCGPIKNMQNPLVVTFPRNEFNIGVSMKKASQWIDLQAGPNYTSYLSYRSQFDYFSTL